MTKHSNSNILIIGAGTWGSSIALELARRGHVGITVLDGSPFPSAISAGNDLNKIAEEGMLLHSCFSNCVDTNLTRGRDSPQQLLLDRKSVV